MDRARLYVNSIALLLAVFAVSAEAEFNILASSKLAATKFFTVTGGKLSTFEATNLTRPIAVQSTDKLVAGRIQSITAVNDAPTVPDHFELSQNFPNPFNMSTKIVYSVPVQSNVSIIVYDMLGRQTAVLQEGAVTPGTHVVHFERNDIASGAYFYRFVAVDRSGAATVHLKKMILMK